MRGPLLQQLVHRHDVGNILIHVCLILAPIMDDQ